MDTTSDPRSTPSRGSLYARLKRYGPTGFGYGSTAEEVTAGLDLTGRTANAVHPGVVETHLGR